MRNRERKQSQKLDRESEEGKLKEKVETKNGVEKQKERKHSGK